MPSDAPSAGDFYPARVQKLLASSNLRMDALVSPQQEANVAAVLHPFHPVVATAWYGPESHVDLWDLRTRENLHSLTLLGTGHASEGTGVSRAMGHNEGGTLPIRSIAMHPDGRLLAVGAGLSVWLLDLGAQARLMREGQELFGHQHGVHDVAFSSNGKLLASACDGGRVLIWSLATFEPVGSYHLPESQLRAVAFSQDDALIATGDALGNVSVWDLQTNLQIAFFQAHDSDISDLTFAPNRRRLATAGFDGAIRIWDIDTEQPHGDGLQHGDAVYNIRFSTSGNLLYSCGFDAFVGVWDVQYLDLIDCYRSPAPLLAMALSDDERTLALVTTDSLLTLHNGLPDLSLPDANIKPGMTLHDMLAIKRPPAPVAKPTPPPEHPFAITGGLPDSFTQPKRDNSLSIPPGIANSDTPIDALLTRQQGNASDLLQLKAQAAQPAKPPVSTRETTLTPTDSGDPPSLRDQLIARDLPSRSLISNAEAGVTAVSSMSQSASQQPDFRYDREANVRSVLQVERPAKPNTRLLGAVISGALILALIAGVIGAATGSSGPDPAASAQRRAEIEQTAQQQRDVENQRHAPILAGLQNKLDKVKQGGGSQSVTPLVKALEKNIQEANASHESRLNQIQQEAQQQLQSLQSTGDGGLPLGRILTFALPAGLLGAIALAFFLKRSGFGEE